MKSTLLRLLAALTLGTCPVLAACDAPTDSVGESSQEQNEDVSFDLMHTRPECSHEGHPSTWCTMDDLGATAALSGMEAKINAILDRAVDPAKAKIKIAYFSFSAKGVFRKLCEKGRAGFDVEGFFDQSYRTQLPAELASCQGPGGNNVRVHFLGQLSNSPYVWRLHHNKFLIVDSGDERPVSINFSSGNLSSYGLSEHFDHWVMLTTPRTSSLAKTHFCVTDALAKAIRPDGDVDRQIDDPAVYRTTLDACLSAQQTFFAPGTDWVERAIDAEKVAPLFSPDPAEANARILIDNIGRVGAGGTITGAMQHFLHYGIASALRSAVARGVSVRLVMDAALLTGGSEVPGVKEFYDWSLKESVTGIKVQFLVVNSAQHQMMHNKFLVMEGIDGNKTRVFSGAGHFTDAGLRDNYENFYLSQSDVLSSKYHELFDYLWTRSLTETAVLAPPAPPAPPPAEAADAGVPSDGGL